MDYIDPSRLELGQEIGRGSFGSVNAGRLRVPGRNGCVQWIPVALKQLTQQQPSPSSSSVECTPMGAAPSEQFMKEIISTIQTSREVPNVVECYGWTTLMPLSLCLVMKLYKGTLHSLIRDQVGEPLPLRTVLCLAQDMLRGLSGLHSRRVIFDDFKPANVLLEEDDSAALADFGLSRPVGQESVASTATLAGTCFFMAPEKLRHSPGERLRFSYAVDMWAFGITMIQLLECNVHAPYGAGVTLPNIVVLLMVDKQLPTIPPTPEIPQVQSLLQPCLDLDPAKRPPSAALLQDIEAILSGGALVGPQSSLNGKELEHLHAKLAAVSTREQSLNAFERSLKKLKGELEKKETRLKREEQRLRAKEEDVANRERKLQNQQATSSRSTPPTTSSPRLSLMPVPLCTNQLKHGAPLWSVAFHPNGTLLFTAGADFTIKLWDLCSCTWRGSYVGHSATVLSLSVCPDGKTLVSSSDDKTVRAWEVDTYKLRATFGGRDMFGGTEEQKEALGHRARVNAVAVTPDGQTCVSASRDTTIKVWDLSRLAYVRTLKGHTDTIPHLSISPDGNKVASCSWDRTVRIWDWRKGHQEKQLEGHTGNLQCVHFLSNNMFVSCAMDCSIRVWDLTKLSCVKHIADAHNKGVRSISVSSDGAFLVSASNDGEAKIWDTSSGGCQAKFPHPSGRALPYAHVNPNNTHFATACDDGVARVWQFQS